MPVIQNKPAIISTNEDDTAQGSFRPNIEATTPDGNISVVRTHGQKYINKGGTQSADSVAVISNYNGDKPAPTGLQTNALVRDVMSDIRDGTRGRDGTATVVVAATGQEGASIGNIGDSQAFLVSADGKTVIKLNHSQGWRHHQCRR
jgi:serine/threonine protein phosphatase PrpC